ncbi:MAG: class I SAM-dependent methyltransferase [Burkholderiales bacterium]
MARFDNPLATWQARYAGEDYHFGEAPNAFVARHAHRIAPGGRVLCVADGEGRNSVHLAAQGARVTAFDFAPNALAKARRLAHARGVTVDLHDGDIYAWDYGAATYDAVVAVFIQFMPPEDRDRVFARMQAAVVPGGLFLLEGYRPEQVDYGTGGPPHRENMYTRGWLEQTFAGWDIEVLDAYDAAIQEGPGHDGMSALIDLVARRR